MQKGIIAVTVTIFLGLSGTAVAYEGHYNHKQIMQCRFQGDNGWQEYEVKDTIRCAFIRVGDASQRGYALYVADRESGFYPLAYNPGGYGGLFQHSTSYWPGRYAAFPAMNRWFHLPPSVFDARTNAFVTARMVGQGNWGPWQ